MGKVIIGIHGLGNKPPENVLKDWWIRSIREGLDGLKKNPARLPFEMVYWAPFLHPVPLDPNETEKENKYYIEDPYVPAGGMTLKKPAEFRRKVLEYLEKQLDKLMLREDFSINFSAITDIIIRRFFKDLDLYFNANCLNENYKDIPAREKIRSQLYSKLKELRRKKILLIAHSMGSIIAYDVLLRHSQELEIDTLVTIGSPLGVPAVMQKIARENNIVLSGKFQLATPDCIRRHWYNFSDLHDKVAFNYNLSDDYHPNNWDVRPIDSVVFNNYEIRGVQNPHKSYGYLRTPEVAHVITEFLAADRAWLLTWISTLIKRWRKKLEP